jgi:DNA polymerase elongation subunit (family B)
MATYLQPCDWIEHDVNYKYVVDVFGRTDSGDVAKVRLTDFKPYLYIKAFQTDSPTSIENAIHKAHDESQKKKGKGAYSLGLKISRELKQDAMQGFNGMNPVPVWKIVCKSLFVFKTVARLVKSIRDVEDIYEADLPPLLRLFHEQDIAPASPLVFDGTTVEVGDDENVDICLEVEYSEVRPFTNISIPLLVGSYDIEVYSSTGKFPVASNAKDEITQIGVSFRWNDTLLDSDSRFVFVNGTCEPSNDPTVQFVECKNEKDLLQKFAACIRTENPDIMCGYNTFGFDDSYIADRASQCKIGIDFGRIPVQQWSGYEFIHTEKKTFEVAAGKFAVRYISMPGRMGLDLYLIMRREQNLDSYKLDNIANKFLRDKVSNIVEITGEKTQLYEIHTKNTRGLFAGNLVRFDIITNTSNPYCGGQKFFVKEVYPKKFIVELPHAQYLFTDLNASELKKLEWSFAKDDVDHHAIFAAHVGSAVDRANIAKYCIQDCDLVLTLIAKLDTLVNARGMADVCRVPAQFTFLRGQGIKIYSAVVYNASKRNQVIMTQDSVDGDASYEGAIVLPPKIGMYLEQPIPVLDFNSLYPSNMIAYNLSPDTLVYVKKFNEDGQKIYQFPGDIPDTSGFKVDEISYDEKDSDGNPIGRVTCGFAQPGDDGTNVGLLPQTLDTLLKKRKDTRKLMEKTDDDAQKSVLNGLQLAYKVVANSVYGQCGSRTSPIRNMYVAACTTAIGRQKIYDAKKIIEEEFAGEVIYGDTDSVFIKFQTKSLSESIELGKKAAERITSQCRKAHRIEYEKTLYPFILFCRKRYVGMLYEDDPTAKPKRKEMGIALKRRDSAPIVKDIFGGALDILMEERDIRKAQRFVADKLADVLHNKFPLEKFIITKQLGDDYKNPEQLAHVVLANRMKERDPGSAPQVGDRLAYVYVAENAANKKQGDRIETIDYIRKNSLHIDNMFYIKNQIQNPVAQLFALAIEQLEGYKHKTNYSMMLNGMINDGMNEEEATLKVLDIKQKELDTMMFLGKPEFVAIVKKIGHSLVRGPMDMFLKR